MEALLESLHDNKTFLWWMGITSVVMFVGTLVLVPILVVKIPEDYFMQRKRHVGRWDHHHPVLRWILIIAKNLFGVLLVLAGLAMIVGPGQGALTILIGVMLVDFPGKYRLERWIIRRRTIQRAANWIRKKAKHPPLQFPEGDASSDG